MATFIFFTPEQSNRQGAGESGDMAVDLPARSLDLVRPDDQEINCSA